MFILDSDGPFSVVAVNSAIKKSGQVKLKSGLNCVKADRLNEKVG